MIVLKTPCCKDTAFWFIKDYSR